MHLNSHRCKASAAAIVVVATIAVSAAAPNARADEGRSLGGPLLPAYRQECSACHVAYPPGLLPAASWQRLMGNLDHHFGTNAALDAPTVQQLSAWLTAHAARSDRRPEPPQDRITRSAWFLREHDEVDPATWKLAAVKSPANCAACHTRADQGDFNEHNIRIPR